MRDNEKSNHIFKLRKILNRIGNKVNTTDEELKQINTIMGVDTAYLDNISFTAGVLLSWPKLEEIKRYRLTDNVYFPYIPTLLSFREGPPIIKLLLSIKEKPDIVMINSHGIAHPQFCGCATYVGVLTNKSTIGIAKRILVGKKIKLSNMFNGHLIEYQKKIVGAVLNPDIKSKRIIVSPGHKISLKTAVKITLKCLKGGRLPLPIKLAHQEAEKTRRHFLQ
ncbi:MAG: endonuclease V [Candidatus Odinarchaeia archaeon]